MTEGVRHAVIVLGLDVGQIRELQSGRGRNLNLPLKNQYLLPCPFTRIKCSTPSDLSNS